METRRNMADYDGTSVSSRFDEFELEGKQSNGGESDEQELNIQSEDAFPGNENDSEGSVYNI